MINYIGALVRFSTASSFRSRSRLSEFYKATHPDLLGNAPEHVKEENSRSLKFLNSYFDSLSQNQKADGIELTFYIPSKVNKKSRKFYPIQVAFDSYRGDSAEDLQRKAIERTTTTLLAKVQDKQKEIDTVHLLDKPSSMGINVQKSWFNNLNTIKHDILEETGPLKRRERNNAMDQVLHHQLFTEANRENLSLKINKEMRSSAYLKYKAWQDLTSQQNIFEIFSELIDPRLIYMDAALSSIEIDKFNTRIVPDNNNMESLAFLKDIFSDMEANTPQISLYVTKAYSSEDIPGFFSIPYNFEQSQLKDAYIELKMDIVRSRKLYEEELSNINTIEINLKQKFNILKITNKIQLKNSEQAYQVKLILLRFQKALQQQEMSVKKIVHMISNCQIIITDEIHGISQLIYENKIASSIKIYCIQVHNCHQLL